MKMPVFSVYDSKSLSYSQPFVQHNADVAKRAFAQAATQPGNNIYLNPTDYSLIEIGEFDDETGVMTAFDHVNHGLASQFIQKA